MLYYMFSRYIIKYTLLILVGLAYSYGLNLLAFLPCNSVVCLKVIKYNCYKWFKSVTLLINFKDEYVFFVQSMDY